MRTRLTAWYSCALAAILLVLAVVVVWQQGRIGLGRVDRELDELTLTISGLLDSPQMASFFEALGGKQGLTDMFLAAEVGLTTVRDLLALRRVATLTGAMNVALGAVRIGAFANNDRLYQEVERAASAAGERLWRMPMDREYFDLIKSDVADVKNTGGAPAGRDS